MPSDYFTNSRLAFGSGSGSVSEENLIIMSSPGKPDLRAGHAPAVKVGGVRIPGKIHHEKAPKEQDVEDEEFEETPTKSPPSNDVKVLISGAPSQGNKDFPPEAIKQFHEKPMPTHQKNVSSKPVMVVQQPRKN